MTRTTATAASRARAGAAWAITPLAAAIMFLMNQPAQAGNCTPGPVSVCSGEADAATDATQTISDAALPVAVTTDTDFGLIVTNGGYGIDIVSKAGLTFTDMHTATIETNGLFAINADNTSSENLTLTSTGSLKSTGAGGDGLRASNTGADTRINLHNAEGDENGAFIHHNGTGDVHIVSTGKLTGLKARGLNAYVETGTSLTIETVDTEGQFEGLFADNKTIGSLTVTSTGLAKGVSNYGILADNYGTDVRVVAADTDGGVAGISVNNDGSGSLSIISTGLAKGTGAYGILAVNNSGTDVRVVAANTDGGATGISANNHGSGSLSVTSTGLAKGATFYGIHAYNHGAGTDLSVNAVHTDGGEYGITALNEGSGSLSITSTGLAKGASSHGIYAYSSGAGTDVGIDAVDTHGGATGIGVNHQGTGALTIRSRGTAHGSSAAGIFVMTLPSSTHATIQTVDTSGSWGINISHTGTGTLSIQSTGSATGQTEGIYARTAAGSAGLTLTANDVTGGTHGIHTDHRSLAGTPGNTAAISVTGRVQGGTGQGIATKSNAGVLTRIHVGAGAVVGAASGQAISNDAGDSDVDIHALGTVNGTIRLGDGNDTLTLRNGFSGATLLDGGGGGRDILNLSNASASRPGSQIARWTELNLDNVDLTLTGGNITVGTPADPTSGIFLRSGTVLDGRQDNLSISGNLTLAAGTRFLASGYGGGTNTITGSVNNAGRISAADGGAGDVIRIQGDYVGQGGLIALETRLGDDTSPTDRVEVGGSTVGTSTVQVINTGGTGAATHEGIEVIRVGGASNGVFTLLGDYAIEGVPVVVAGAYSYRLLKGNRSGTEADNWFLRSERIEPAKPDPDTPDPEPDTPDPKPSDPDPVDPTPDEPTPVDPTPVDPNPAPPDPIEPTPAPAPAPRQSLYQPGVPVYEAYPQALLKLNALTTLQQRVGNRHWRAPAGGRAAPAASDTHAWVRIDGTHLRVRPDQSTTDARLDHQIVKAQMGVEHVLHQGQRGALYGGVTGHYTQGVTKTRSPHGDGRINTRGYGVGATLTWYGHDGFYVDNQVQLTRYRSDLRAHRGQPDLVSGNRGIGYALSIETGRQLALSEGWSITPQAQLVYSHVDFDRFVDRYGAPVSRDAGASLQGRLGVALEHQAHSQTRSGRTTRTHAYGIANLYYEFLDDSRVIVDRTRISLKNDRLWAGLGIGGSYSWRDDTYTVYAEGLASTSLARFGASYSFQGKIGVRIRW